MKTAIAIAAHPDDIEFLMSGTLMLLRANGYEIHYWNLANGCCGTTKYDRETIAGIRREEAMSAAAAIGATFHESICNDLEIFYDKPTLAKVASVIREVAPEIVLTHSPSDYMEDHTNTCRLATTAAFTRGMPNFPVDPPRGSITNNVTVYHAQPYSHRDPLGRLVEPAIVVDVSDLMAALDEELGRMSTLFKYAEGWRKHLHLGFCGEKDDPLHEALKERVLIAQR